MTSIEILSRLRQLNVGVRLGGDRLFLDAPNGVLTDDLLAELSSRKAEVISILRSSVKSEGGQDEVGIERTSREGLLPLSDGQERLWVLDQLRPGGADYLLPAAVRVRGDLNVGVLRKSLGEIVRRHESLRTRFPSTDGVPYAVISDPGEAEIAEVDLRDRAPAEREREARRLVEQNAREPFDLARGPLWRMKVLRLGEREYVVLSAVHHVVFDGWSMGIFMHELVELYTAALEHRPPVLSPVRFQFADYVHWQKRRLAAGNSTRNLNYWKAALGEKVQPLDLPADRPSSSDLPPRGGHQSLKLPAEVFERLKALSHREGASLYMTLLAAFHLLLHRLTHQEEILVGTPVAGRDRTETESLIGFFVNTIVMRADFRKQQTFRELLQQVRETALEAYAHQDMPFEELVAAVDPERDLNRAPLFQVFFNHLTDLNRDRPPEEVAGLRTEWYGDVIIESKFHMTLYVFESPKELSLVLVYNAQIFNSNRIKILLEQYQSLLEQIVKDPDRSVGQYSLVTPLAVPRLPQPAVPLEVRWTGSVEERFLAQAARRPDAVAISEPGGEWTYGELERGSGALAAWVARQGIGAGDIVAIYGHRSASLVLAMLGVLRAGAAFCILDPAYPPSRLCQSFEAVGPKGWLQIAEAGEPPESLQAFVQRRVGNCRLSLSGNYQATGTPEWAAGQLPQRETDPDSLAYVTFTSGTTGEPKCVLGTHRPLSHFVAWHCTNFGLRETDRFSMLSGLAHDPLLRDIFTPLWLGATLCIPEADEILAPGYLSKWMHKQHITVSHLTPAMGALLAESATVQLPALRYAFFGGDLLTHRIAALLNRISPDAQIVNFYGATETPQAMAWHSIDSAQVAGCEETEAQPVPIGNAIPDVQLLILNRAGGLVGPGEMGEIFIRTPYLTLGYANDEELTRERFVVNPFTGRKEDRLYRTGDLGRYRPDGIVEFVGRADQQIKIRGYRVELGEIEAALAAHESVRQCVVVAGEKQTDGQRLVAYLIPASRERPRIDDLRDHLNTLLPDYMIPSAFAFIESIPLTPNGKVNRSALPVPDLSNAPVGYVPPRNEVERVMAKIWAEVLGLQKVGVFGHFFELGGHSLSATRLIARLRSAFQMDLPLKSIFLQPTIAEMSKHILYDGRTRTYRYRSEIPRWNRLLPAQPKGSRNPLFVVAGYMNPDDTLLVLSRIFPHLGLDQPVFGFQPRWLDGHSDKYASVEEVAREFVTELRDFRPEGPYLLGGDCVGGIVALEMARELSRQGQEIGLLVMFDTERPTPVRALFANLRVAFRRGKHMATVVAQIIQGKDRSRAQLIRDLVDRKRKTVHPRTVTEIAPDSLYRARLDYRRMIYRHKVKKYPGQITLLLNEQTYKIDQNSGWNGVATGGLKVHSTPGGHLTRFTVHGKEFAKQLLECLERAQAESAPRLRPSHDHVKVGNAISCTDG